MYQELPFVAAIIITKIHSSSMVIPFPITPSGFTSVKKIQKFLVVSNKARAYISLFQPETFSISLLITTKNVMKAALRAG